METRNGMLSKEDKFKRKKRVITDALMRCLDRDVYSKITVQDIADEAGFSKGGVLHYFSTKEDIYLDLIRDIFREFEKSHRDMMDYNLKTEEMAPLSALLGVESFFLNKTNLRITVNLILYSFEEEKIRILLREYISKHNLFYANIIEQTRKKIHLKRKSDIDVAVLSRIAQSIVVSIGILEAIDPTDVDYVDILKFITSILKG
ncbi:MAG: TetR/AcrR family transcriptional regulator [Spirochaetes bacterium]|nr:TetR/AcrR family transcriptional regulator [Spirochaetota bacterium]